MISSVLFLLTWCEGNNAFFKKEPRIELDEENITAPVIGFSDDIQEGNEFEESNENQVIIENIKQEIWQPNDENNYQVGRINDFKDQLEDNSNVCIYTKSRIRRVKK